MPRRCGRGRSWNPSRIRGSGANSGMAAASPATSAKSNPLHTIAHVLLNRATAEGIARGDVSLVLRRWDRARVKPGGTQRTIAGTIRVDGVQQRPSDYRVTEKQARAAGFTDAVAAQAELERRPAAYTYLIAGSFGGDDERPAVA